MNDYDDRPRAQRYAEDRAREALAALHADADSCASAAPDYHDTVEWNMTNHPPTYPNATVGQMEALRRIAKVWAHAIVDACPDGRERAVALTHAEESLMWAIASIARQR